MVLTMSIAHLLADLSLRDQLTTPLRSTLLQRPSSKRASKVLLQNADSAAAPQLDAEKSSRDKEGLPRNVVLKAPKKT
jgi:hypothetical protein